MDKENKSIFERHLQTGISTLLVGLILWVGTSVTNSREAVARLEEKFIAVESQLSDLKSQVKLGVQDRYFRAEAVKDFTNINSRVDKIERRVHDLESEVNKHSAHTNGR